MTPTTAEDDEDQIEYLKKWREKHPDYGMKRKVHFTVPGEPMGKERPKFSYKTGHAYTPPATIEYQNRVVLFFKEASKGLFYGDGAIILKIRAYYAIPKSASAIRHRVMALGIVRPLKKPDSDNVGKCIADALNGVAYHDDAAVVEMSVEKWYSDTPRVEVTIESMKQGM